MGVTFRSDATRGRTVVTVPPGTRWSAFEAAVMEFVSDEPGITRHNLIIDDQGPIEDVAVDGMGRIGEAFRRLAGERGQKTFTVVVTSDRFFAMWAKVIDAHYGGRKHHSAPSVEAAERLLDRLEASSRGQT